ncbi:MAG: nitrous oxide reductase family maturation protein NosD, partial [Methanosarcinales archaeon]
MILLRNIISLLAWSVMLVGLIGMASATTLTVHPTDPSADHTKIQYAIDNATAGDTIEVWNSTYNERVTVNEELTIYARDGAENTIVDGYGSGNVFYVTADNVTINNFTVTNGNYGVYLSGADNCSVTDNEVISNTYYGIYLYSSDNNNLSNNNASSQTNLWYGAGIYLGSYNDNNTIYNNTANNNRYGIRLNYQNYNNNITSNTLNGNNRVGFQFDNANSYYNEIKDNKVNGDYYYHYVKENGITIQDLSSTASDASNLGWVSIIEGNNINANNLTLANNDYSGSGLYLYKTSNSTFEAVNASKNRYGIY